MTRCYYSRPANQNFTERHLVIIPLQLAFEHVPKYLILGQPNEPKTPEFFLLSSLFLFLFFIFSFLLSFRKLRENPTV